jgi:hypothetical protein
MLKTKLLFTLIPAPKLNDAKLPDAAEIHAPYLRSDSTFCGTVGYF